MSNDSLSDEDKALFRQLMSGVKPLASSKKIDLPTPKKEAIKPTRIKRAHSVETIAETTNFMLSDYYTEEVPSDAVLSYTSHNIPNKRLRELKNGIIPWQARLDLHGFRQEDARLALINFIGQQSDLNNRCLLIIHGKGSHNGKAPVLKNLVRRWLPQFPQVLAFHSALTRDGGAGA